MNLKIIGTSNSETPNEEVVMLQALANTNLNGYAIVDHTFDHQGESNIFRHIFMFPDYNVLEGEYVVLCSCNGNVDTMFDKAGNKVHKFYWGSDKCIWNDKGGDKAVLIQYKEIGIETVKAI